MAADRSPPTHCRKSHWPPSAYRRSPVGSSRQPPTSSPSLRCSTTGCPINAATLPTNTTPPPWRTPISGNPESPATPPGIRSRTPNTPLSPPPAAYPPPPPASATPRSGSRPPSRSPESPGRSLPGSRTANAPERPISSGFPRAPLPPSPRGSPRCPRWSRHSERSAASPRRREASRPKTIRCARCKCCCLVSPRYPRPRRRSPLP